MATKNSTTICFNPCSGGSASQTVHLWRRIWRNHGFQSLFWWIGLSNRGASTIPGLNERFQSLFWWIGLSNCKSRLRSSDERCFNPCSGGSASQTIPRFSTAARMRCFNPCSGGSASQTQCPLVLTGLFVLFQSLFWWIGLSNIAR